jgi:hypothetical protein
LLQKDFFVFFSPIFLYIYLEQIEKKLNCFSIDAADRNNFMKTFGALTNHKKSLQLAGFVLNEEIVKNYCFSRKLFLIFSIEFAPEALKLMLD